jgi:protein-tyrosine kinase
MLLEDPKSIVTEAYRVLRTNLQFAGVDKPLKKIMVTSSIPREGKSTVIANLAISVASAGYKILLVDADLRRPKQHKNFMLENHLGLSNLLAENLPLDNVIQKTKVEKLDVITSGPVPPNPAEILGSARMKDFIDEVSSFYDIVLFDTPPVNSVADASILSVRMDGVILVIEANSTEREAAIIAKQQLKKVNARILGVILNKVQQKSGSYYYYYYYYGEDNIKIRKKKRKKSRDKY